MENLLKKNTLKDFLSSLNAVISTNENTGITTGFYLQIPTENHQKQGRRNVI